MDLQALFYGFVGLGLYFVGLYVSLTLNYVLRALADGLQASFYRFAGLVF